MYVSYTSRAARRGFGRPRMATLGGSASVAQLVEHFTRNEGVSGSSPLGGFEKFLLKRRFALSAFALRRELENDLFLTPSANRFRGVSNLAAVAPSATGGWYAAATHRRAELPL